MIFIDEWLEFMQSPGMKDSISDDSELLAMHSVAKALNPLDEAARRRVFVWTRDKFGFGPAGSAPVLIQKQQPDVAPPRGAETGQEAAVQTGGAMRRYGRFPAFADFYHALSPKTDSERALAAAAWMQDAISPTGFDGFSANKLLKQLGYKVSNITRSFDLLMEGHPSAIMQLRKAGTSQQARKSYKVTDAGFKRIQNLLVLEKPEVEDPAL